MKIVLGILTSKMRNSS